MKTLTKCMRKKEKATMTDDIITIYLNPIANKNIASKDFQYICYALDILYSILKDFYNTKQIDAILYQDFLKQLSITQ